MKNSLALAAILLALRPAGAFAQASAELSRVGAAAAVRGGVRAVAPNAAVGRVVESGKPLYLNDHVTTNAAGRLQVLLLDETVFTLGPDSDMTLDEFVYDPKTSAGKVAAEVSKGAFRFVTGKVARSRPENMTVKLAVGTIGIRGTVVEGETGKAGSTVLNVGEGPNNNADDKPSAIIVSNAGVSRLVDLTGQGVKVLPGQAPSFPHDMADEIKRISALLAVAPKDNPGKEPGEGSVGENSGQLTAAIKDLINDIREDEGDERTSNSQANLAAQFGSVVPDGLTNWDFIRQNQPSGRGMYFSGEAPISSFSGGFASSNPQASLQLQIDFAARTIGGSGGIFNSVSSQSGSFIHIHGVGASDNSDFIQQQIGTGVNNATAIPFSSLSGPAKITLLNGANLGTLTTGAGTGSAGTCVQCFNNSTISLVNAGGVVAAKAQTSMTFSGSNAGSISANASGTFLSPR